VKTITTTKKLVGSKLDNEIQNRFSGDKRRVNCLKSFEFSVAFYEKLGFKDYAILGLITLWLGLPKLFCGKV